MGNVLFGSIKRKMEQILTIIVWVFIIVAGPFLVFGFLYGVTMVKMLIEQNWKKPKGLLSAYERLTPDQRMDLELHRDEPTTPTQAQPKENNRTQWLGSPKPEVEIQSQSERVFQEGVVHSVPGGAWESHEEANKAPETTITNPEALKPKP